MFSITVCRREIMLNDIKEELNVGNIHRVRDTDTYVYTITSLVKASDFIHNYLKISEQVEILEHKLCIVKIVHKALIEYEDRILNTQEKREIHGKY